MTNELHHYGEGERYKPNFFPAVVIDPDDINSHATLFRDLVKDLVTEGQLSPMDVSVVIAPSDNLHEGVVVYPSFGVFTVTDRAELDRMSRENPEITIHELLNAGVLAPESVDVRLGRVPNTFQYWVTNFSDGPDEIVYGLDPHSVAFSIQ